MEIDNTEILSKLSPGTAILISIVSTIFTGFMLKFGEYFLEKFKDNRKVKEEKNEKNIKAKLDDHIFLSAERDKVREELIEDNDRLRNIIKEKDNDINNIISQLKDLQDSYRNLVEKHLSLSLDIEKMRTSHKTLKGKVKELKDKGVEINYDTNFDEEDDVKL